ncbi:MAG: GTP-binding protein [Candidatus Lokiarchaeota archaeon]|nr:GTP-binding protein [Candidatus Lokiarchaeota archaeon]
MSDNKNYIYKICVVGDGGVGKTSMVLRFCENTFKENYIMTIGSNFSTKTVELPEYPNVTVKLQLWDLAGQKHFSFVRPPFYRGSGGVVFVFDLTRRSSFANLAGWKSEVEKVIGAGKPYILVGNKLDITTDDTREVSSQDGESYKNELGAISYIEASAKQDIKIGNIFKDLTISILKSSGKI